MAQLTSILDYLTNLLVPHSFDDVALNGLQVESAAPEIRKVAVAVDAGLSVIEQAIAQKANLLIVHHGLFWGSPLPITGVLAKKIQLLQQNHCSLYASHLPLDAHQEVGNGFELARFFDLGSLRGFCEYHGTLIGAQGIYPEARPLDWFVSQSKTMLGAKEPLVLAFGKKAIRSVGIVTGSGAFGVQAAVNAGLDLYISGEPKHEVYHLAKELRMNALFAGHYATETFGVRAIAKQLEKKFDITTVFVDEASGI